jgi:hypothetical protein
MSRQLAGLRARLVNLCSLADEVGRSMLVAVSALAITLFACCARHLVIALSAQFEKGVTKVVGMLSPIGPFGLQLVPKFPVVILDRRKAILGSSSSVLYEGA